MRELSEEEKARKTIRDALHAQKKEIFGYISELDRRLTQTNLVTNGSGAVALLAYINSNTVSMLALLALTFFAVGVISAGIEIRTLIIFWGEKHKDVSRRFDQLEDTSISPEAASDTTVGDEQKWATINHWAGVLSQACFALGFLSAAFGIVSTIG